MSAAEKSGRSLLQELEQGKRYSTALAGAMLGKSVREMKELRYRGDGPAYFRIGKECIYLESDLIAYLESRRFRSTREEASRAQAAA